MIKGLAYLLAGVFSASTLAQSAEQELRDLLSTYDGYSAEFEQTVVDSQGTLIHQAQGNMSFEQPGKFIWQVTEPEEEVLLSNGTTVWWYNPFVEQVSIFSSEQAVDKTPFALLVSQDDATWAQFKIKKDQQDYVVESNQNPDAAVKELRISFAGDALQQILIVDRSMQTSRYKVSKQKFEDIVDSSFDFVIPDDTEIDDQRQVSVLPPSAQGEMQ